MAERFVKTIKEGRYCITFMPTPDVRTALRNLAATFTLTVTMKVIRTVRWEITLRGNTDVRCERFSGGKAITFDLA